MATGDQVKALIRSHADGDDTRFYAIAMQVAAQAARSGHGKFAQELRDLVDQVKARAKAIEPARGPKPVPLAQPRGELAGLLTVGYPKTRLVRTVAGSLVTGSEPVIGMRTRPHRRRVHRAAVLRVQHEKATVRRWRDDGIGVAREASRVLAELRALLLPKLLCGGLRIRDTEHAVEGVA